MSLKEYSQKRDFRKTSEPNGEKLRDGARHQFVIQKHEASRLHYDFRLEIGGTLKSWAVPKGIPFARGEKRLAVHVEDHPVSYIDFEGTIPKGQYGGGTVMVWDKGTFSSTSASPEKDLASGKLHFTLNGNKLSGEWYLVRIRDEKQWLLIRGGDTMLPVSKRLDDTSALSGKTMAELSKGERVSQSNRVEPKRGTSGRAKSSAVSSDLPKFIEPMKARLVAVPPVGDWVYEIKFDGFRALVLLANAQVRLLSRNEKDFGAKFPEVVESFAQLKVNDAVIDGEIVALESNGRSSFQLLQAYDLKGKRPPIYFYAFDLLQLNGKDLRQLPLTERKEQLERLLQKPPGIIRYSASLGGDVKKLLKQVGRLGLEGLIGKRKESTYEAGQRSGAWVKLKLHQEQEFVIGGYSNPEGARSSFGALLVGYYEKKNLKFAGKVGTGFNDASLKSLYSKFQLLKRDNCPFTNLPEKRAGRYGAGVTVAEMRRCHWVEPTLVCQIKFSEWTRDGKLRQPVFLGLREDKDSEKVIREKPK